MSHEKHSHLASLLGRNFVIEERTVALENGKLIPRAMIKHPGAAVVVPKSGPKSLFVIRQYRFSVDAHILEFPAGTLDPGEEPLTCAKRELIEEISQQASRWTPLGALYPCPGFCDEIQHLFFAEDLSPAQAPGDEDEVIEVLEMKITEVEQAIVSGQMLDAKSIAAFCRARLLGLV